MASGEKRCRVAVEGLLPKGFGLSRAEVKAAAEAFAERSRARMVCGQAGRMTLPVWHEVIVHLVDDAGSDAVHRAIMGLAGVTDVVTQAYDAIPPESPGLFGELFVNVDQAMRAAPKRKGWSAAKELLLYVAHGMDHLSGADDMDDAGYRTMRRRELGWLRELK